MTGWRNRRAGRAVLASSVLIPALLAVVLACAMAPSLSAQDTATVAIMADRLIVGDGTTVQSPVVLVRGQRFVAVGTRNTVAIPRGARVIELPGHTLLPGFIDMHTHLTSIDNDGGDLAVLKETGAHGGIYATINAKKTLDAGFTTIREAGSTGYVDVAIRDAVNRGLTPGPRIFASGPSLGSTGGHADVNGWSHELAIPGTGAIVDGPEAVRRQIRLNAKYGADHIKIVATGGILSQGDAVGARQFDDDELHMAVAEANRLGRKVMAHAHAGEGLLAAVNAGVASIEHGSLVDDAAIAAMKTRGTFLVPTLIILEEIVKDGEARGVPEYALTKARSIAGERRRRLRAAFQAGVRFALGTDATSNIHGRNGEEFRYMVEILGASPMDAILIGTRNAAELLGMERELGTVAPGKLADLVAVPENPLEDISRLTHVRFVMKDGTIFRHDR